MMAKAYFDTDGQLLAIWRGPDEPPTPPGKPPQTAHEVEFDPATNPELRDALYNPGEWKHQGATITRRDKTVTVQAAGAAYTEDKEFIDLAKQAKAGTLTASKQQRFNALLGSRIARDMNR